MAEVNSPNSSFVQIFNSSRIEIKNGTMNLRDSSTFFYNQIWEDKWQCTIPNGIYYFRIDTPEATRTTTFTCFSLTPNDPGCQNGGIPNIAGNCTCPPGYEGDYCDKITCYNGGEPTDANTCECPSFYTGPHCDIANFTCQRQPKEPVYSTLFDTLILVVDISTTYDDIIGGLQKSANDIPEVFQQFILATSYYDIGDRKD